MELLTDSQIEQIVVSGLDSLPLQGKRLLVIVPDQTRSMPMPLFFRLITAEVMGRVKTVDFLVALGTHPPLSESQMLQLFGLTSERRAGRYGRVRFINHAWKDPAALAFVGEIPAAEIEGLSGGLLRMPVPVRLNCRILEYDHLLICGPVFPHEVAGFSGGNKYFFPGIAGAEIIDFTHWLGALLTSYEIIGVKDTPVRAVIDRAAALIPTPRHALCSVVTQEGVAGVFFGTPERAWSQAADLSAQVHIRWLDRPFRQVLSILPTMYTELWLGAKGMYKTEPVVADGGEVILYAPHLGEIERGARPVDPPGRVPRAGLFHPAVGPVQRPPLGCAGPLDAPARRWSL